MEQLMELPELTTAYKENFEKCCTEGGFAMDLFLQEMMEWMEVWMISVEQRETCVDWLESTANDEYSELCAKYNN